jgi:hypothetical protein
MDPFSITVGVTGLADVTFRLVTYLSHVKSASAKIQEEINILSQEITSLRTANEQVQFFWDSISSFHDPVEDTAMVDNIWTNMAFLLQQSKRTIEQLEVLLKEVLGKKDTLVSSRLDSFMAIIRKEGRHGEYTQVRQRLSNYQLSFQTLMTALNTCVSLISTVQKAWLTNFSYYTIKSHTASDLAVGNHSEKLQRLITMLQDKIITLRRVLKGSSDSNDVSRSVLQFLMRITRSPLQASGFSPVCRRGGINH